MQLVVFSTVTWSSVSILPPSQAVSPHADDCRLMGACVKHGSACSRLVARWLWEPREGCLRFLPCFSLQLLSSIRVHTVWHSPRRRWRHFPQFTLNKDRREKTNVCTKDLTQNLITLLWCRRFDFLAFSTWYWTLVQQSESGSVGSRRAWDWRADVWGPVRTDIPLMHCW